MNCIKMKMTKNLMYSEGGRSYELYELNLDEYKAQLAADKQRITAILTRARAIDAERDGKLEALKQDIRDRAENPTS